MSFTVYILYSSRLGRFYVGSTNNINRRLCEHNNRESPYTSAGVPWLLLWKTTKYSLQDAELLEQKLKHLSHARKIRFMHKHADGIADQELLESLTS